MLRSDVAEAAGQRPVANRLEDFRSSGALSPGGPKVLVIGSAHLDVLSRYSEQHAGVADKPGRVLFAVGGSAFNVAADLAWAGRDFGLGQPLLYTHLRAQSWSTPFILEQIRRAGIDSQVVQQDPTMPYESAFVGQFRGAELETAVSAMAIEECTFHPGELAKAFRQAAVAVADCNLSSEQLQKVLNLADLCNVPLVIDAVSEVKSKRLHHLSRRNERNAKVIVVLTQNEAAAAGLMETYPENLCEALRADSVLLTKGANGWSCLRSDGSHQVVYASQVENVRSSAGAGDAVVAAVATACALGVELEEDLAHDLIHNFTTEVLKRSTASMGDSRIFGEPRATRAQ